MKVLLAVSLLLLWAVAESHFSSPYHNLERTPYVPSKTHQYELWLNLTAGVPGLTGQFSKSIITGTVKVYPKTETDYLLKIDDVKISEAVPSVPDYDADMRLKPASRLQSELSRPIKFTLRDGKIQSYTLHKSEGIESKRIKRSVLRHFEFELRNIDVYNITKETPYGPVTSWYTVNVSPYVDLPYEQNVFNVSRSESYEWTAYPATHSHHNFARQGCPEVCRTNKTNVYGAGCPHGYEPNNTPVRISTVAHYDLTLWEQRMILDNMLIEEQHVASMYDQDMVVTISAEYKLKDIIAEPIHDPDYSEVEYTDLETEIEPEVDPSTDVAPESRYLTEFYPHFTEAEAIRAYHKHIDDVVKAVARGNLEQYESQILGEKLILLQKIMSLFRKRDFQDIWRKVVEIDRLRGASEEEKLKRQLVVDLLPLVGTEECIEFIKYLIEKEKLSAWEAKEVLEAIPENLLTKDVKKVVKYLYDLLNVSWVKNKYMLYSAAHLTVARVLRKSCAEWAIQNASRSSPYEGLWSSVENEAFERSRGSMFSGMLRGIRQSSSQEYPESATCPHSFIRRFIKEIGDELSSAKEMHKKVIYIETLAHTGSRAVLPYLAPYLNGTAEDIQEYDDGDIDFLKTVALYSLHHITGYYPREVLHYVVPIYFNLTEVPRARIAAFSVLIRCQPPMALLKHIALDSWKEPSYEVGSFVYSTVRSFGNSTDPCTKLTAKRIKHVIGEFQSFDIGHHHAEAQIKNFFDKIRSFGLTFAHSFVASNESFIPSALYTSAMYNIDSLREDLWKLSVNIQGLSGERLLELIDLEVLNLKWPESIPKAAEQEIFGSLNILPRLPKNLRITLYRKIFYSPCYIYLDMTTLRDVLETVGEHVKHIYMPQPGVIRGHFLKVYMPSSHHSFAIGRTTAFPVEFYMKHPIVYSVKVESTHHTLKPYLSLHYEITPSVYYTAYHEKYVINPVDKKAYGVYFENKYALSVPFKFYMHFNTENNTLVWSFKYPEEAKKLFRYHSEAGTFASDMKLTHLPSSIERDTITTIPTLFRKEKIIDLPAVPPVYLASHSEDISEWTKTIPRNLEELVELGTALFRNPGWRRKEFNATLVQDPKKPIHSVLVRLSYNRTDKYVDERSIDSSMLEEMYPAEGTNEANTMRDYRSDKIGLTAEEAKKWYRTLVYSLSHVYHEFEAECITSPYEVEGRLRVEYNHTHDKQLHALMANATCYTGKRRTPYEGSFTHVMRYRNTPCEFKYDSAKYGSQRADCYCSMNMHKHKIFDDADMTTQASFLFAPYKDLFSQDEFPSQSRKDWFLPETHEECLHDISKGKSLSTACIRAIKETAIFNRYKIQTRWNTELPSAVLNVTDKINQAIKYALYSNADVNHVNVENPAQTLTISADYVDRLTDVPVINVHVWSPKETAHYHNINAKYIAPLSGLYDAEENFQMYWTNNSYPPTCAVMKSYIKTFDLKSFKLPEDKCKYLLSAHCTEKKNFAVFVQDLASSKKEVEIHVGKDIITLSATRGGSQYNVEYNRRKYKIALGKPIELNEEAHIHAFLVPQIHKGQRRYVLALHCDVAGIRLHFDGSYVKLQVHPLYKGKVCGLCSEFDGEVTQEFRGVDQCLYTDSEDFAHSSIVNPQECGVSQTPKGPVLCQYGQSGRSSSWTPRSPSHRDEDRDYDEDESEWTGPSGTTRPRMMTIHMQHDDFICFSTKPVPSCPEEMKSAQTEVRNVEFHCLPKYDSTTRRLLVESERRIIHEVENKSVDFVSNLSVPKSCEM